MHGNLPAALQYGTAVSASKPEEVDKKNHMNRTQKSADGVRNDSKYPEEERIPV